jgi:hypothetical protein
VKHSVAHPNSATNNILFLQACQPYDGFQSLNESSMQTPAEFFIILLVSLNFGDLTIYLEADIII